MSRDVGVLRDEKGLAGAARELGDLAAFGGDVPGTESWETTNLLTVAAAMAAAALRREETRGAHWRDDHPDRDDADWRGHLDTTLGPDGALRTDYVPIEGSGA